MNRNKVFCIKITELVSKGGGYTPSRVSFSPLFSYAGNNLKAIILKSVVKVLFHYFLMNILHFRVCFSLIFSNAGYQFEGNILKPRVH